MKIRYSAYSTSMIFYTETLNLKPGIVVIFSKKFEGNPLTIGLSYSLICLHVQINDNIIIVNCLMRNAPKIDIVVY